MKGVFTLINLLMLLIYIGKSQTWYGSGTVLHRSFHSDFAYKGYIKYVSNGTVTVNSLTCQQILVEKKYVQMSTLTALTQTSNILTNFNGGLVTKYVSGTNSFDTIYNFNAAVGDQWSLTPKSYTNCSKSKVLVTAVGTKTLQGIPLKWLKVTISGYSSWSNIPNTSIDTIIERMGTIKYDLFEAFNICPWVSNGSYGEWIRCYSDNQINNYKTNLDTFDCNYYLTPPVSIREKQILNNEFEIFPNPTRENIHIKWCSPKQSLNEVSRINIFSAYGKILIDKVIHSNETTTIETNKLTTGIYIIKLIDGDLKTYTQKLIVE